MNFAALGAGAASGRPSSFQAQRRLVTRRFARGDSVRLQGRGIGSIKQVVGDSFYEIGLLGPVAGARIAIAHEDDLAPVEAVA